MRPPKSFVESQTMIEGVDYQRMSASHVKNYPHEKYETLREYIFVWYDGRTITIDPFTRSDGATKARDLCPLAFFVHDQICKVPYWDNGDHIPAWLASRIYRKILEWHGFHIRSKVRSPATWLWGIIGGTWSVWKRKERICTG